MYVYIYMYIYAVYICILLKVLRRHDWSSHSNFSTASRIGIGLSLSCSIWSWTSFSPGQTLQAWSSAFLGQRIRHFFGLRILIIHVQETSRNIKKHQETSSIYNSTQYFHASCSSSGFLWQSFHAAGERQKIEQLKTDENSPLQRCTRRKRRRRMITTSGSEDADFNANRQTYFCLIICTRK